MTKVVVLDPGHGGSDPGSLPLPGNKYRGIHSEASIVLRIAKRIRDILTYNYSGAKVVMTRSTNTFVSLTRRSQISNNSRADLFVSIHLNSFSATANGYESFNSRGAGSRSVNMTGHIHNECMKVLKPKGFRDRGRKRENFSVIYRTTAPAILTENLFISNARELEYLVNGGGIEDLAQAHARGIAKALGLKAKEKPSTPPKTKPNTGGSTPMKDRLYTEGNTQTFIKETRGALQDFEKKGLSSMWRKKLDDKTLTTNEALGLMFTAIRRGYLK